MNADDISDFLRKVKEAEEVGLTPAEVWRAERFCPECDGRTYLGRIGVDERRCPTCDGAGLVKVPVADGAPVCRRCKRPTEYQAKWCSDCEIAIWGNE